MRYVPIDELDDSGPPQLPLIRFCGAASCRRRARPGGRHCSDCHAAAVRRWRDVHRRELTVRRRDEDARRDEAARARDSARAKLAMAIRRGKINRGRCHICGSSEVIALIADPSRPLDVAWICRDDRRAELEQQRAQRERQAAATVQAAWDQERAAAREAIAKLPLDIQAELAASAARGPGGICLAPEAPLYIMQLVRAYRARPQKP